VTDRGSARTLEAALTCGFLTLVHDSLTLQCTGRIAGIGSDTEEDGGSTPPAPTVSLLSSAFVGLLVRLVDGIGRRGRPPIGRRLALALVLRAPVPADRAAEGIATLDNCSTALRSVRTDATDRDKLRSCAPGSRFRIAGMTVTTPNESRSASISARSMTCGHAQPDDR
jgi:hypothetical protein